MRLSYFLTYSLFYFLSYFPLFRFASARSLPAPLRFSAARFAAPGRARSLSSLPYPPYYYITYYFLTIDNTPFLYTYK